MTKKTYRVSGALPVVLDRVSHEPGTEFQYGFEPEHEEFYIVNGQLEIVDTKKKGE